MTTSRFALYRLGCAAFSLWLGINPLAGGVCDSLATFADGRLPTRQIFVSTTGDDSSGDGTRGAPFRSVARATKSLRPGEALRLLPGAHAAGMFLASIAGTSNAPIWFGGEPGQPRPKITGNGTGIHLSRVKYLVIENLDISGVTANGINADDGGDYAHAGATGQLLFRHLTFSDIGTGRNQDALKLSGVYDFAVVHCDFSRTSAGGSAIDHVGCHRGVIARCNFTDLGSNGVQCKGGSQDIEIRWNRFTQGGQRAINIGGSTGFQFFRPPLQPNATNFEAKNIRVLANVFRGSDAPIAFVGAVDSIVAQNTIVEPRRWIARILQETVSRDGHQFMPCGRNQFVNNLIYFQRNQISTPVNIGANTDPASFQFSRNLWYAADQPDRSKPDVGSPETEGFYGVDPRFRNAAAADFALRPDSPAGKKGKPSPVKGDFAGRCYGLPPALGAFELGESLP